MKTLAFVTQKGGAGKSTLAASLAVAAQEAGETVAILDLDPQGSIEMWASKREADTPAIDSLDAQMVGQLPDILPKLAQKGYSLVILDTAGVDTASTRTAMQNADLSVIPCRPTAMDIRATKATHEAAVKLGKPFMFVLNQCPPQPNNSRAAEAKAGLSLWGVLAEPLIIQRAAQQDAFASSMGVTEYEPNGKAAQEVRTLWVNLKAQMEGTHNGKAKTSKLVG